MLVKNFIKKLSKTESVNLKEILKIRTYIPIAEKRVILETVLDKSFTVEDGVLACNYILKKMAFELAMIKYHTNLDIDITSEDDYDEIQQIGISLHYNYLEDYKECQLLFEGMEQELRAKHSIESSVASLSNKLSNGIENVVTDITKKINDFDMSNFGFEKEELDKLKILLNMYGSKV